jgi:hypothetical protein
MGFSLLNYDSSVDAHNLLNVWVYWALNSIVNRIIDQLQTAGDSSSKNKRKQPPVPWLVGKSTSCSGISKRPAMFGTNGHDEAEPIHWRYRFHICLAYFLGLNFRGYTPQIWSYMVQYLHFRILEFP